MFSSLWLIVFCLITLPSSTPLLVLAADRHAGDPFALRISCGSRVDVRTPQGDALWYRDFGYTGGRFTNVSRLSLIAPPLATVRFFPLSDGPENCYDITNVPSGRYQVRVFFALADDSGADDGEPLFDVSVDGTLVAELTSGWSRVDDQSFAEAILFVKDSDVSVCFHSTGHGDPSVLSIEVLQVDDDAYHLGSPWGKGKVLRTVKRLSCGSGKPAFDVTLNGTATATNWGGDRYWSGVKELTGSSSSSSGKSISTENVIAETMLAPNYYPEGLYQSAIISTDAKPDLYFETEVEPNKNYSVWLHFAEIETGIVIEEQRVFDILINGEVAFERIDVIRMAGERFTAVVLNKTVNVVATTLTIMLRAARGSRAIVNAIEVLEVLPTETRTSPQEIKTLHTLKSSLGLPVRFGWNGDPCVPQQHPWSGIDCQLDSANHQWVIDGLGLDNQGLMGFIHGDISNLKHLQTINLSSNSLHGSIPSSIGRISGLQVIDLSFNELNGSIPDSLGKLSRLQILNLNENHLSGKVPANLGGLPLHRARFKL